MLLAQLNPSAYKVFSSHRIIERGDKVLKFFLPDFHVKTVFELTPNLLKKHGIKGIVTDLDNTLVAWDQAEATKEVVQWMQLMEKANISVTIISNNNKERVQLFSEPIEIPYIPSARKPLGKSFRQAAEQMNLHPFQIAVVGDQVLTDVLGGNLAGCQTVLVKPVAKTDAKITTFNRMIERRILNYFRRRGKLKEEGLE